MSGISKLVIKAYSDENFSSVKGEFSASINPANIKITSSVDYERSQGMGSSSMALRYNISPPRSLSFKLLFDNTGIIPESDANVKDQLENLQNLVYAFQDDINSPYYVRVIWGVIDFKGKLVSLETSYNMFQADGSPIRAEVDIVVLEEVNSKAITKTLKNHASRVSNNATMNSTVAAAAISGGTAGVTAGAGAAIAGSAMTSNASASNPTTSDITEQEAASVGDTSKSLGKEEGTSANRLNNTDGTSQRDTGSAATGAPAEKEGNKNISNTQDTTDNEASALTPASKMQQVKADDTLPAIAQNSLGDANLSKKLANLNGLDSLRNLKPGISLGIPLSLAGLLAGLVALGKKYASKSVNYLKKKGKAGKEKAVAAKNKVKSKL